MVDKNEASGIIFKLVVVFLIVITFILQNNELHIAALLLPSLVFILLVVVGYYAYFVRMRS